MSNIITKTEAEKSEEEKNRKFLNSTFESSAKEVARIVGTSDRTLAALETEVEAQAFWNNSPKLREEFKRFETFKGYWAAMRAGQMAVYGFGWKRKKSA